MVISSGRFRLSAKSVTCFSIIYKRFAGDSVFRIFPACSSRAVLPITALYAPRMSIAAISSPELTALL